MPREAHEIAEIIDTMGEKLPNLINALKATLYSVEAGRELGRAVGAFYRELVDSGMPSEFAMTMAGSYMEALKNIMQPGPHRELRIRHKRPDGHDQDGVEGDPECG